MVENIAPDIYRIEVPLKNNPLKSVNSYVIKSPDRALIIDTAMNRPDCLEVLTDGLRELNVDPANSDYFVSHRHGDHHGLITTLAGKSSRVYMGRVDLEFMKKAAYGSKLMLEEKPRLGAGRHMSTKARSRPAAASKRWQTSSSLPSMLGVSRPTPERPASASCRASAGARQGHPS